MGKNSEETYSVVYQQSIENPEDFWSEAARGIDWDREWDQILDNSNPPFYRWFVGAKLNTCYNALDRHVTAGRGDQTALIYDSAVTSSSNSYTYAELRDWVARFAGALSSQGIAKGDRVILYMPMVPEAVVAMLACARIGAIHSVVFGGFAARELATRIDDAKPKIIVAASCGIEVNRTIAYKPLLDEAISIASHKPSACIILQREQGRAEFNNIDLDWDDVIADAKPADCVSVEATDPLYILYTSGTTGEPKGVVRDNGGHAVALKWSMPNIFASQPGDVYWAASDVGWVVGHSYIVYGPLLNGGTSVLYEGKPVGTPDPGAFWRVIQDHRVNTMFTAPTAFRAIKREDADGKFLGRYDTSSLRALFLAGERCDPDTLHWSEKLLNVPVIDHWWQTETGWPIAANCLGIETLPVKPGSPASAVPGYSVSVLDADHKTLPSDEMGDIVLKLPLPPGCLTTLWGNDQRFVDSYMKAHPGYYITADAGYKDEDGYLWIMSRTDDIINVAGHRLSTGAMEEVLSAHADVAECAVMGVADSLKGQVPLGLVVCKAGAGRDADQLCKELVQMVREHIGPVAAFKQVAVIKRLPKTRSGKVLRATMRKIADGEEYRVPATIDDPAILDEIATSLSGLGYPRSQ